MTQNEFEEKYGRKDYPRKFGNCTCLPTSRTYDEKIMEMIEEAKEMLTEAYDNFVDQNMDNILAFRRGYRIRVMYEDDGNTYVLGSARIWLKDPQMKFKGSLEEMGSLKEIEVQRKWKV